MTNVISLDIARVLKTLHKESVSPYEIIKKNGHDMTKEVMIIPFRINRTNPNDIAIGDKVD